MKRDIFLSEMDVVVSWARLEALISPHYTKSNPRDGRPQVPLSVMLRIYLLQGWYSLTDPGAEKSLYDMQSMRGFVGLELGQDAIPDETTILNFRRLLETHKLTKAICKDVSKYLEERSLLLRGGTIMDATLIAASPSTKNKSQRRVPDMSHSRKGNQWHFGIGVNARSGLIHTLATTTGTVHDAKLSDELIRVCAKVEHVFRVIKCQFGYRKVRYKGLQRNTAPIFSLRALANLYMARNRLRAQGVYN